MPVKINKPNETNNIISMKRLDDDVDLAIKGNSKNIIGSFYFDDFSNTKSVNKFIRNIESRIRTSKEYNDYIGFLNNELRIDRCSIFGNITNDDDVSLEFHHYPFTLYDIVEIVINDKVKRNEKFTSFDIISEVLDLHKKNMIGLTKLCKTAHELVHDGQIFVKLESVFGKVNSFIEIYEDSIPEELKKKYNDLIEMNELDLKNYALYLKEHNPEIEINIDEESNTLMLEQK